MRKLIIGLAATGAVIALGSVAKHKAEKMREHCREMGAKCKEKMAEFGAANQEAGAREETEPTGSEGRSEVLTTA
jgi:hypothetical protein